MIRDLNQVRRIVGAIVSLHLHYEVGAPLGSEWQSAQDVAEFLRGVSLEDLVQANMLARANKTAGDTLFVACDDSIIAALYCALHHEPQPNHSAVSPIFELHDRALALVTISRNDAEVADA